MQLNSPTNRSIKSLTGDYHDLKHQPSSSYIIKLIVLSICILLDLISNSSSEFETLTKNSAIQEAESMVVRINTNNDEAYKRQFLLSCLQILSQTLMFTIMFSQLCATLPFQIGLMNVLFEQFFLLVLVDLIYIVFTLATIGTRMSILQGTSEMTIIDLLNTTSYTILSFTHKLVAPSYYAQNLKSLIQLGSPEYYSKRTWYEKVSHIHSSGNFSIGGM